MTTLNNYSESYRQNTKGVSQGTSIEFTEESDPTSDIIDKTDYSFNSTYYSTIDTTTKTSTSTSQTDLAINLQTQVFVTSRSPRQNLIRNSCAYNNNLYINKWCDWTAGGNSKKDSSQSNTSSEKDKSYIEKSILHSKRKLHHQTGFGLDPSKFHQKKRYGKEFRESGRKSNNDSNEWEDPKHGGELHVNAFKKWDKPNSYPVKWKASQGSNGWRRSYTGAKNWRRLNSILKYDGYHTDYYKNRGSTYSKPTKWESPHSSDTKGSLIYYSKTRKSHPNDDNFIKVRGKLHTYHNSQGFRFDLNNNQNINSTSSAWGNLHREISPYHHKNIGGNVYQFEKPLLRKKLAKRNILPIDHSTLGGLEPFDSLFRFVVKPMKKTGSSIKNKNNKNNGRPSSDSISNPFNGNNLMTFETITSNNNITNNNHADGAVNKNFINNGNVNTNFGQINCFFIVCIYINEAKLNPSEKKYIARVSKLIKLK